MECATVAQCSDGYSELQRARASWEKWMLQTTRSVVVLQPHAISCSDDPQLMA